MNTDRRGMGRAGGFALAAAAAAALLVAACGKPADAPKAAAPTPATPAPATTAAHTEGGIDWKDASNDSQIDAAFAAAREANKPVFVYWGAKWCPPCNQVKATLFNRQDFIERSRGFVPVYVDGDSPGAQKIGARFHVSGYPTMVLFTPQGQEVTRLPGEVDPVRYTQVLTLGMNASRPVAAVLADALARPASLGTNDWRLLAFYSWDTDQQQVIDKKRLPATLLALADACPADAPDTAMRLRLKALAAADAKAPPKVDTATRAALVALLGDSARSREQTDMLTNYAAEIVRAASAKSSPERTTLLGAFDTALKRLEADTTLSRADRMQALIAQVDLARIDDPEEAPARPGAKPAARAALPAALVADVREQTSRADREITNGYERQAVITAAAYLLERAGLDADSDALLKANLAKSHSPYYLMSELASNAKKRGDSAEALRWYREAFEKSEGPATRLQWGSSYIAALVDLAPNDESAIEAAAGQLWSEAEKQPDAFYQRSGRALGNVGTKLQAWNKGGAHRAAMKRLQTQLHPLCAAPARSSSERATCEALLTGPAKQST
ncbi:MAG: thioredoxin family protein [Caldimonas sp.]